MLAGLFCFNPFLPLCNPRRRLFRKIEFPDFANLEAMVDKTGFDTIGYSQILFNTGLLVLHCFSAIVEGGQ